MPMLSLIELSGLPRLRPDLGIHNWRNYKAHWLDIATAI